MKKLASIFTTLIVIGVASWAYLNSQWIADSYVVHNYTPAQDVHEIASQLHLTDEGKRYFYIGQPDISTRENFNKHCQKRHEKSVVLGCYVAPYNIYIYDVADERLNGVKQVTAAHEMLHVVYDRLSTAEKKKVDTLLEEALPTVEAQDKSLAGRLEIYEKTEPGEKYNELHSILGTEAATLPTELEQYYSHYFTDRKVVTDFAAQYSKVFIDLQKSQDSLVQELKSLAAEINIETTQLNQAIDQLNNDVDAFNQRARIEDSFTSQQEFDNERQSLINRRDQLSSQKDALNAKIALYNQKRDELQQLNVRVEELNTKLDSTVVPDL